MKLPVAVALTVALLAISPIPAVAQSACDADLSAASASGESVLRQAVVDKLLCEYSSKEPGYLERALFATTFYFEHSSNPACEILLEKASLHIRAAEDLNKLKALSSTQRDAMGKHWGAAWDMATGISYAWTQSEGVEAADEATRQALNDQVYERCVGPARGILSEYPSVTITVLPEDADGYALFWDETRRHDNLPRILPGKEPHRLRLEPPPGHRTTVRIDGRCFTQEGPIVSHIQLPYRDPVKPHQVRIHFTPIGERVPEDVRCSSSSEPVPCGGATPCAKPTNWLLWSGVAAAVVGGSGLAYSLYAGSSYQDEANALETAERCRPATQQCYDEYEDKSSTSQAWYGWGGGSFGVLTALGITGIIVGLVNTPGDSEDKQQTARVVPFLTVNPGQTSLGVTGSF